MPNPAVNRTSRIKPTAQGRLPRTIEAGHWPAQDNPLKHAPHTQADLVDSHWNRPYSREQAVFPLPYVAENKFWPRVNRVDDVYGDRHLFCACVPLDEHAP